MGRPNTGRIFKRGRIWHYRVRHGNINWGRSLETDDEDEARKRFEQEMALFKASVIKESSEAEYGRKRHIPLASGGDSITVAEAWQRYMDSPCRRDTGKNTLRIYESQYRRFRKWMADNYPDVRLLTDVTKNMAQGFASEIRGKHAPGTYNKYIRLLRMLFRVLFAEVDAEGDPWRGIQFLRDRQNSRRALTEDEMRSVLSASSGEMRNLILLGIHTGLRLGDACCLQWQHVHLEKGWIKLVPRKTAHSSGKSASIPIHFELQKHLRQIAGHSTSMYVSPKMAARYGADPANVTDRIQTLFRRCGIRVHAAGTGKGTGRRAIVEVGYHSFRHTLATRLGEAGVDSASINTIAGWGSPAMLKKYTHVSLDHLARGIARLNPMESKLAKQDPVADIARMAEELDADDLRRLADRINEMVAQTVSAA